MKTKWLRPRFLVGEGGVLSPEIHIARRLSPPLLMGVSGGDGVRVDIHVGTRSGSSP